MIVYMTVPQIVFFIAVLTVFALVITHAHQETK
jgi:hypothetical protein